MCSTKIHIKTYYLLDRMFYYRSILRMPLEQFLFTFYIPT